MTKRVRAIWLVGMLGVLLLTLGTGTASAKWGLYDACGPGGAEHCYAEAEDDIETFAIVGLEETRYATVPGCNEDAAVSNEIWADPKAEIGGGLLDHWIETGQVVGEFYCDQKPHVFTAEVAPGSWEYHFEESGLPTWEHQLNMYAISDIPEKNGRWYTYYRIPNESGVWTVNKSYGGGWSKLMYAQASGMEAADSEAPSYEGAEETLWTNGSIEWPVKTGGGWTGAKSWAEYGNTCIQALTGSGAGPGNDALATCPL
jgi:hypothetical protein